MALAIDFFINQSVSDTI